MGPVSTTGRLRMEQAAELAFVDHRHFRREPTRTRDSLDWSNRPAPSLLAEAAPRPRGEVPPRPRGHGTHAVAGPPLPRNTARANEKSRAYVRAEKIPDRSLA